MKLTRSTVLLNNYIFDSYEAFWWKCFKWWIWVFSTCAFQLWEGFLPLLFKSTQQWSLCWKENTGLHFPSLKTHTYAPLKTNRRQFSVWGGDLWEPEREPLIITSPSRVGLKSHSGWPCAGPRWRWVIHLSASCRMEAAQPSRQVTECGGRDSTGLIITVRLIEPLGVINTAAESRIPWAFVERVVFARVQNQRLRASCDFDMCELLERNTTDLNTSAFIRGSAWPYACICCCYCCWQEPANICGYQSHFPFLLLFLQFFFFCTLAHAHTRAHQHCSARACRKKKQHKKQRENSQRLRFREGGVGRDTHTHTHTRWNSVCVGEQNAISPTSTHTHTPFISTTPLFFSGLRLRGGLLSPDPPQGANFQAR